MTVDVNRDSLKKYGLRAADVLELVEIAIGGKTVTTMYEGERMYDLVVRYPEDKRNSIENLKDLLVDVPAGYRIPLGQLARIAIEEGPAEISREAGFRRIGIEVNVSGRDLGGFVEEAGRRSKKKSTCPKATGWNGAASSKTSRGR